MTVAGNGRQPQGRAEAHVMAYASGLVRVFGSRHARLTACPFPRESFNPCPILSLL